MTTQAYFIEDLADGLTGRAPNATASIAGDDEPTTLAVGEEGDDEGDGPTTLALGEEGDDEGDY
ncbi:MAG: hypothetical protein ACRDTG_23115 [Pseudonocardiaceae bacterium]